MAKTQNMRVRTFSLLEGRREAVERRPSRLCRPTLECRLHEVKAGEMWARHVPFGKWRYPLCSAPRLLPKLYKDIARAPEIDSWQGSPQPLICATMMVCVATLAFHYVL